MIPFCLSTCGNGVPSSVFWYIVSWKRITADMLVASLSVAVVKSSWRNLRVERERERENSKRSIGRRGLPSVSRSSFAPSEREDYRREREEILQRTLPWVVHSSSDPNRGTTPLSTLIPGIMSRCRRSSTKGVPSSAFWYTVSWKRITPLIFSACSGGTENRSWRYLVNTSFTSIPIL